MVKYRLLSKSLKPKYIFPLSSINSNSLSYVGKSAFSNNSSFQPFRFKISYNSQITNNKLPKKNISSYINDSSFSSLSLFKKNENKYGFNESIFLLNSLYSDNQKINKKINSDHSSSNLRKKQKSSLICKCGKSFTRKESLQKHIFYTHSGYKGKYCSLCGKLVKRFNDHLRLCKLKHELNKKFIINNKNQICDNIQNTNNNIILKQLFHENNKDDKNNFQNFLKIGEEENYINLENYRYYLNYMIGSGGNMEVFYGIEKKTKQDVAVKIEFKEKKIREQ